MSDIAVQVELDALLRYLDSITHKSEREQLDLLRKRIEDDVRAAKDGWL